MPIDQKIVDRILELREWGYLELVNGKWMLTELGWCCLSACADKPNDRARPPKRISNISA